MGDANLVTPPAHAVSLVRPAQYRPIRGQQSVSHKADHFASSHFLEPGGTKRSFHCIFSPARQSEDVPLCLVTRSGPLRLWNPEARSALSTAFFFQLASQKSYHCVSSHAWTPATLEPGGTKRSFHCIFFFFSSPVNRRTALSPRTLWTPAEPSALST